MPNQLSFAPGVMANETLSYTSVPDNSNGHKPPPVHVPEPSSIALLAAAMVCIVLVRLRRA